MNKTPQEHISLLLCSQLFNFNDFLSQNSAQKSLTKDILSCYKI